MTILARFSISIHAPAKGATDFRLNFRCLFGISIHAPAKGATEKAIRRATYKMDFNPRSREGSDQAVNLQFIAVCISIHAPAKGATSKGSLLLPLFCVISIHAPAKGATKNMKEELQKLIISIHAPAKGATVCK